jgi:hypothetical protein
MRREFQEFRILIVQQSFDVLKCTFWIWSYSLRGYLINGSEPARVAELTRFPEMNFTARLHETFWAGWLVKTNTNFRGKVNLDFGHAHKDIILLESRAMQLG